MNFVIRKERDDAEAERKADDDDDGEEFCEGSVGTPSFLSRWEAKDLLFLSLFTQLKRGKQLLPGI